MLPHEIDAMSPGEVWRLRRADRQRFNRVIRTVAWALAWIPTLVYKGVRTANSAKPDLDDLNIDEMKIAMTAPDYDRTSKEPARRG